MTHKNTELHDQIIRLRQEEQLSFSEIAEKLGCSDTLAHKVARHIKVDFTGTGRRTPEWHALAKIDALDGMSNRRIGEKYGVCRKTVANVLSGVAKPHKRKDAQVRSKTSETAKKLQEYHMQLLHLRNVEKKGSIEIAQITGRSRRQIQNTLKALGAPFDNYRPQRPDYVPLTDAQKQAKRQRAEVAFKAKGPPKMDDKEMRRLQLRRKVMAIVSRDQASRQPSPITLPRVSIQEKDLCELLT